ncbi:MAG TPA: BTAD domain-containing putative transcriptional regulator [Gaiellaceae bacterium]|jgi:DNA-binding SARP family transcriptional activator/DNA-binding beta-propeller fold protein YncE|nr:BTAD domain-containing putative transcriptional regulator [Gaiellaceae bacterium]
MAIEIRLLGPLEALVDNEPVELGPPQQRTLLALLSLHAGTPVRLGAIEEALWDGEQPRSATKLVQTYISRLRKLLGPDSIQFAPSGYILDSGSIVDALRFRELVDRGRLDEALALWRGNALSDIPALASDARHLDELRLTAIEEQVATELEAGEGPALVKRLEPLVAAHPTRERLLGQLVLALYRSGRQADALAAYRRGRAALVEDLGLEPGPALHDLELRILRHDPTLLPAAPAPSASTSRRRRLLLTIAAAAAAAIAAGTAIMAAIDSGHAMPTVPIRANRLLELDPKTNRFVSSIPIGRDTAALDATPDALWAASERERTVLRIDLRTREVKTIGRPHPVAFIAHDDRGNIYVSGWDYSLVSQIDPRTVEPVRSYSVKTRAVGLAVGGGSLWVVDRLANAVTRIDLAQHRVAETIRTGINPLAVTFGYGALWVANGDSGTVSVIRPGAATPIQVKGIPSPDAVSAGAGGVWVASTGTHSVFRIDPDTHAIIARINLRTPEDFVSGVSAGPHGVWAVEDHDVVRIDPSIDRVTARIRFPRGTEPKAATSTPSNVWISVGNPRDDM